jgi:chemotaxis methyl-accepting protein methylase/chemotaxis signal transduction protein
MRHLIVEELRRRIGLNPDSIGPTAIDQAIDARMRQTAPTSISEYARRLETAPAELQDLVNEIVVPETWFFRSPELFGVIVDHVRRALPMRPSGQPVRILSAACSTGEEPYSIAIALQQGGIPAHHVRIDAVDLSTRHLQLARDAVYGDFSFRNVEADVKRSYFQTDRERWRLHSFVRDLVHFRPGNLIDPLFLGDERPYDIVLCRNVFIYLTPAARGLALANLARLLAPDGLLALGHAESSELADPPWQRFGPEAACAFRRSPVGPGTPERPMPRGDRSHESGKLVLPVVLPPNDHVGLVGPTRRALPVVESKSFAKSGHWNVASAGSTDCWNTIGVRGDRTCPQLADVGHCYNCNVFSAMGRRFLDSPSSDDYVAEWTDRLSALSEETGEELESVLVFRIAEEWVALPVRSLLEVTTPRAFHRIPHRGGILEGLINIRGELYLQVRLDQLIGLTPEGSEMHLTGKSRLLVFGRGKETWAFLVDQVDGVHRFPTRELSDLPATLRRSLGRFTNGVLSWDGRTAGLLDETRLLDSLRTRVK